MTGVDVDTDPDRSPLWRDLVKPATWWRQRRRAARAVGDYLARIWNPRPLVDFGLLLTTATATAAAALVLEDVFPKKGFEREWNRARMLILFGAIVALGFLAWRRSRLARNRGTLYYVRLLDEAMGDEHDAVARRAGRSALDFRSVTRWIDSGDEGAIDGRRVVDHISTELERAANDDVTSSGFEFVPNLLMPFAVAAGYRWSPPTGATLREVKTDIKTRKTQIGFQWRLDRALRPQGARVKRPFVDLTEPTEPVSRIVVSAALTDNVKGTAEDNVRQFPYADAGYVVGVFTGAELTPVVLRRPRWWRRSELSPQMCVEAVGSAVRAALNAHPDATIILAGQMPKSVALAVGWWLANKEFPRDPQHPERRAPYSSAMHPWRRLVAIAYLEGQLNPHRPVWALDWQTNPDDLLPPAGAP